MPSAAESSVTRSQLPMVTSSPELAKSDGPILYRKRFELPAPAAGERRWVTFDGIFYQADVWLDGAYRGDPEGYFFPHSFDITALSRLGERHVLAVEVACDAERGTRGRRNITGLFQHSEAVASFGSGEITVRRVIKEAPEGPPSDPAAGRGRP